MEQKIQYYIEDGEIDGLLEGYNLSPDDDTKSLANIPEGFNIDEKILWKYDATSGNVEFKTGEDLADATASIITEMVNELIREYAGYTLNPVTLGQIEGACDIVVQFLNMWINDTTATQEQIDAWNSFYAKCSPYFKVTIDTVAGEEDDMAIAKAAARQAEIDMKDDPDWPS